MVGYLLGMKGVAEELMIHGNWWKYAIGNWISTIQYNNMMTEEWRRKCCRKCFTEELIFEQSFKGREEV